MFILPLYSVYSAHYVSSTPLYSIFILDSLDILYFSLLPVLMLQNPSAASVTCILSTTFSPVFLRNLSVSCTALSSWTSSRMAAFNSSTTCTPSNFYFPFPACTLLHYAYTMYSLYSSSLYNAFPPHPTLFSHPDLLQHQALPPIHSFPLYSLYIPSFTRHSTIPCNNSIPCNSFAPCTLSAPVLPLHSVLKL